MPDEPKLPQHLTDVYTKWMKWLPRIDEDITRVAHNRAMWRDTLGILVKQDPDIRQASNFFFGWITHLYVVTQTVGVRRQAESSNQVVSLAVLLDDLIAKPCVMVRDRYVALYRAKYPGDQMMEELAHADFDEQVGAGNDQINSELLQGDRARLKKVSERVITYANKHVAHVDKKPLEDIPSHADLNEAIDTLGELLKRYTYLLTGVRKMQIEPVIQENWMGAFRVAWLPE